MKQPIISFLQTQLQGKTAVLGLSGGVDSAVVAYLLVEAIGADRVRGYYLPSSTNAATDADDVATIAAQLGIQYEAIPIDPIVAAYEIHLGHLSQIALGNLKARVRMSLLYTKANAGGGVVVGTGNKTELMLGYFTKYGDGGVDLLPIAHLYKTEVWQLATELGVPEQIITKPPTAGLWSGQTDEAELGISYANADAILQAIESGKPLSGFPMADVNNIQTRIKTAQHKLVLPPHL
ncbi:MAG: NAD+ synthase [Candidatus Kerfeldbacteria bacterium]|nr:NAD+ synthase [Candidatus Kerfeldbacteria bacterium]